MLTTSTVPFILMSGLLVYGTSNAFPLQPIAWLSCLAVVSFALLCCIVSPLSRILNRPRAVYIVDHVCYQPDDSLKANLEVSEFLSRSVRSFTPPSIEFQRKIFLRSGLGEETYLPPFMFEGPFNVDDGSVHGRTGGGLSEAWKEAAMVMFESVAELLATTGVDPRAIGILITNCSLFSPTPSLASMLVQRFKMKESVKSFHLGGMGCSASVIACAMAYDLLKVNPNEYAMVVSTESITNNWYIGNEKPMLVTNCLFRLGCAAILLTNRISASARSKYELLRSVRTHAAADDKAYMCAFQKEDREGIVAVELSKDLMGVAARALRENIIRLGPSILPIDEQLRFVFSFLCENILHLQIKRYQPDFTKAVSHFAIHAGGRAVIDEIERNLHLNEKLLEPSRATLHRFGNTSASCVWYALAYMETKQRVRKGEKVWMLGLGSGFKCNSLVLKSLADIRLPSKGAWLDSIHRYPACMGSIHRRDH
ncbi:hypothetical protein KP509_05G086300 [Ceratopteris richardii]|uniref:3-ketoacyl-CoA synthase n=1 Tax=Ceratopteris richardii TaxID=49495 RepID=A0A8T2USY8_CERRI|nr:hypothetical protein KP509_05G086300 [Ceratopteris richardii]